jgi:hypothetical protein
MENDLKVFSNFFDYQKEILDIITKHVEFFESKNVIYHIVNEFDMMHLYSPKYVLYSHLIHNSDDIVKIVKYDVVKYCSESLNDFLLKYKLCVKDLKVFDEFFRDNEDDFKKYEDLINYKRFEDVNGGIAKKRIKWENIVDIQKTIMDISLYGI